MKYLLIALVFGIGIVVGRLSVTTNQAPQSSQISKFQSDPSDMPEFEKNETSMNEPEKSKDLKIQSSKVKLKSSHRNKPTIDPKFARTNKKQKNKKIKSVFSLLMQARQQGNIEEQNRLFKELVELDPVAEETFQAKVIFLQEDEDWNGAYNTLKECAQILPESVYCLQRLSNIRSSSIEDKIKYGKACIAIDRNNRFCLTDLAIALNSTGAYEEARQYFERVLSLPHSDNGFNRNYILYQYGFNLEHLGLMANAEHAFSEACELNMRAACLKLEGN